MVKFNEAFASARKSGKKEFTWNGKKYNTKVKGEDAPTPSPRPSFRDNTKPKGPSKRGKKPVKVTKLTGQAPKISSGKFGKDTWTRVSRG